VKGWDGKKMGKCGDSKKHSKFKRNKSKIEESYNIDILHVDKNS
jgi:hypothetical protein